MFGPKVTTLSEILKTRLEKGELLDKCFNHLKRLKILLLSLGLNREVLKLRMCSSSNVHCIPSFCV